MYRGRRGVRLGQSLVVENNTQGAGAVAQLVVANSTPDGHTMLMMTAGYPPQMAMKKQPPFGPLDAFTYVVMACGYPFVYAPDSPIKSFKDLLARAALAASGRHRSRALRSRIRHRFSQRTSWRASSARHRG